MGLINFFASVLIFWPLALYLQSRTEILNVGKFIYSFIKTLIKIFNSAWASWILKGFWLTLTWRSDLTFVIAPSWTLTLSFWIWNVREEVAEGPSFFWCPAWSNSPKCATVLLSSILTGSLRHSSFCVDPSARLVFFFLSPFDFEFSSMLMAMCVAWF